VKTYTRNPRPHPPWLPLSATQIPRQLPQFSPVSPTNNNFNDLANVTLPSQMDSQQIPNPFHSSPFIFTDSDSSSMLSDLTPYNDALYDTDGNTIDGADTTIDQIETQADIHQTDDNAAHIDNNNSTTTNNSTYDNAAVNQSENDAPPDNNHSANDSHVDSENDTPPDNNHSDNDRHLDPNVTNSNNNPFIGDIGSNNGNGEQVLPININNPFHTFNDDLDMTPSRGNDNPGEASYFTEVEVETCQGPPASNTRSHDKPM
jgi:hypothetical protein